MSARKTMLLTVMTMLAVDGGLRYAISGAMWSPPYAVYHFEHGAFVAVPIGSMGRCHQLQKDARDPGALVTVTAPQSIDAAGIVAGQVYNIVGVSCPDDEEGG